MPNGIASSGSAIERLEVPPEMRPSLVEALGELRLPFEVTALWLQAFTYPWPHAEAGKGKLVMLIPGFMAGDVTLVPLANFLRYLGHRPVMSGIWSNSSCPRDQLELLARRVELVSERHGGRVTIIGHSLGGVYARELAHRHPQHIERIITLGSPIHMPRQHVGRAVAAVANGVALVRGRQKGCLSESCSCGFSITDKAPLGIPYTSVYSRTDGIVHWEGCIDHTASPLVENVEVMGSHCGLCVNAQVYRIIADRLVAIAPPPAEFDYETARKLAPIRKVAQLTG